METETVVPIFTKQQGVPNNKMTHAIDMYYFPASPPSRAVLLVAKVVGVELNLKSINIGKGEQMAPYYVKMNPQHSVPTMNDDGFVLCESRAIMQYLVDQYAKDDTLAPKEPKLAAMVNQRLYFDATTLYQRIFEYFLPVAFMGMTPDEAKAAKVEEALSWLNAFLHNQVWAAGQYMTIADIALVSSISTAEAVLFDISKYTNVLNWYQRCKKALADYGYEEINQAGANMIAAMYKSKLNPETNDL